ncbi:MAG: DUF433 domain-containing protein [Chloroflexota bacterium]|nr:MAG: DUF433 domain-containing protein [Chloroflexota bacterium]
MDFRDHITVDPEIMLGKPVVRDTRIPVSLIVNLLDHGYKVERIVEAYPALTRQDIQATIAFNETRVIRRETGELHPTT